MNRPSTEPELQNIPVRTEEARKLRDAFKPPAGTVHMLDCDYSQMELRILAQLGERS